jgi:pimeloyl-ACP methyl ester carboxylesterase
VADRSCILVFPATAAPGSPWIWRMEFFDAWPAVDLALLGAGFHVAYMDVQNMYGAPVALDYLDKFYEFLRRNYFLASRVVLEGFSRGGLFAFNYAVRRPERVASLYLDAPVCDFKSWPAGWGRGEGSAQDWKTCKQAYDLSEADALGYSTNPVDNLEPLAHAGIPVLSVCGDADGIVPLEENTRLVEQRYRRLGGKIQVIIKPGVGHHPHSLEDPSSIVDFILNHSK